VFEYLADEVLAAQPDRMRSFLVGSAALEWMSGPLCDHALGRDDSGPLLAELERTNLFLIPLNGRHEWFRYHHLFRDLLRQHLEEERPGEAAAVQARAGAWYERQGAIAEAIDCYAAADAERASELIAAHYHYFLNRDRLGERVGGWLADLGDERVRASGPLCVARAWIAGFRARKAEIADWLELAEAAGHEGQMPDGFPSLEAEAATVRAACFVDDVSQARLWAERADTLTPHDSPVRPVVGAILGLVMWLSDRPDEARAALTESRELTRGTDWLLAYAAVTGHLAQLFLDEGELEVAERLALEARRFIDAVGIADSPYVIPVRASYGRALALRGELEAADEELTAAIEVARGWEDSALLVPVALITLARVRRARGQAASARELLGRARAIVDAAKDPGNLGERLADAERELAAGRRRRPVGAGDELSERELEVLRVLAGSMSLREIADSLFVSQNTIKTHTRAIYRKLDASSRAEAVERARELGLLPH
jgi:LuxR family transcriptional regulator, maltose regulon positive regulatory protein